MRRIAVINQKGGVGKTTTSANLGAALAEQGRRVLLVDMDAQANLSISLGIELESDLPSTYTVLLGQSTIAETMRATSIANLSLIASNIDLSGAELELSGAIGREHLMRDALSQWESEHKKAHGRAPADYVIFDCPPSLGLLSINALAAAGEVLITLQTEFLALQGMSKLVDVVQLLRRRLNPELVITGILPCLYDSRLKLAREVLGEIRSYFGAQVFPNPVRANVKLAEAPSFGKTIFEYAPDSKGAHDYRLTALEVMKREGRDSDLAGLPAFREGTAARANSTVIAPPSIAPSVIDPPVIDPQANAPARDVAAGGAKAPRGRKTAPHAPGSETLDAPRVDAATKSSSPAREKTIAPKPAVRPDRPATKLTADSEQTASKITVAPEQAGSKITAAPRQAATKPDAALERAASKPTAATDRAVLEPAANSKKLAFNRESRETEASIARRSPTVLERPAVDRAQKTIERTPKATPGKSEKSAASAEDKAARNSAPSASAKQPAKTQPANAESLSGTRDISAMRDSSGTTGTSATNDSYETPGTSATGDSSATSAKGRGKRAKTSRSPELPAATAPRESRTDLRRIVRAEDLPPLPPDAFEILTSYVRDE
jgi:chromosome partitioning protein